MLSAKQIEVEMIIKRGKTKRWKGKNDGTTTNPLGRSAVSFAPLDIFSFEVS